MSLSLDRLPGAVLWRLVVVLWLAFPLFGHAQGLTSPASGDNPFATDPAASSPGFSSARSFRPYGEKSTLCGTALSMPCCRLTIGCSLYPYT
jgi:hypothetical protein